MPPRQKRGNCKSRSHEFREFSLVTSFKMSVNILQAWVLEALGMSLIVGPVIRKFRVGLLEVTSNISVDWPALPRQDGQGVLVCYPCVVGSSA